MRLYRQTVEDFGLYIGLDLESEQLTQLRTAAGEMSAKMRAVRIVSASSVSKRDLEQRLIHKGEVPEQAKAAVEWMEELDLLDDRKTAEQIVSSCIRKGYGMARAKQALYEKRIPRQYWQEALADYPDQMDEMIKLAWPDGNITYRTDCIEKMLPYIVTTHLHDNNGRGDHHQMPGVNGNINWERICNALACAPRLITHQSEVKGDTFSSVAEGIAHFADYGFFV